MVLLNEQYEEQDRSRWYWILAAILLLLLLAVLGWFWWSGSKSPTIPRIAKAAMASEAPAKPFDPPPTSFDVAFGYHQSAIKTNEALTGAVDAWRAVSDHQCGGQACTCQTSARIDVVGHADRRTGTKNFNECISWKRATVVADALAGLGVPRCAMTAEFVGASDIPAPEADEASAAKHRHASITVVAGSKAAPSCTGACRSSLSSSEAGRCEAKLKEPPLLHLE